MNFLVGAVLLLGVIILVHRSLSPQIYKRILHFLHAAFLGKKHPDIILTGSILENFNPFYKKLSPAGKERFIKKCFSFLFNKEFIGCEGLEVTDEMRACIAGTAAQISFGLKNSSFSYYHTIKIFPESFYSRQLDQYLKGGASTNGVLYFSWKDFKEGYSDPTDKYNLGLHEMAHSLRLQLKYSYDFDSRFADYSDRWESIALPEFEKMNQEHISFLRDYGKVNREEFFAVCVEHFFEAPENFRISLPDPPSPRLKSIAETVTASGVRLAGSASAPVADCPIPTAVMDKAGVALAPLADSPTMTAAVSRPRGKERRIGCVCVALLKVIGLFPNQLSSSAILAGRSSQPPAPSGTSSTSSIRSSYTAVTRPSLCPM